MLSFPSITYATFFFFNAKNLYDGVVKLLYGFTKIIWFIIPRLTIPNSKKNYALVMLFVLRLKGPEECSRAYSESYKLRNCFVLIVAYATTV